MKFTVGFALLILGLCVSVQAQTPEPDLRDVCRRQNRRCLSRENLNGETNEVTNVFNNHCRSSNRNWRNVTRCELARANCQLTLVRCSILSCANVRRALGGGGGGGGRVTTPRSPTDPTDDPSPNPEPTRSNPSNRPRTTTRRSRTTTRRTRTTTRRPRTTTRRGRRTTTRRTPTTRRPGRTTTRRRTSRPRITTPGIPATRTPRPPREPTD